MQRMPRWAEEGKKLFIFPKSIYPSSSPAPNVEKKLFEWKFCEKKAEPSWAAAAVACKKSSLSSRLRAKWTFTACSRTKSMVLPEGPR
jgi:hypothetical protein